ncbi:DUF3265 domain-containing protein [Vibrio vulnificus]|nr:DUF3265 domain-containing protein [Vibrio vulnificus]RZR33982.1 DUF3265 domain-containing protein [Vibrio vulnificus]
MWTKFFGKQSVTQLTKRLRGIHAAWHFWYAVSFGGECGLRELGLGGTHPLTRRYVSKGNYVSRT